LRNYGQADRYQHAELGINSRLDPLQAALLSARLPRLEARNERRRAIGRRYEAALEELPALRFIHSPGQAAKARSNRHLFPVFASTPEARRALQDRLAGRGVETLVHYPVAMPDQPATPQAYRAGEFPVARKLADTELSLPVYPEMSDMQLELVVEVLSELNAQGD